jgi:anti-sigma B factor antagonist
VGTNPVNSLSESRAALRTVLTQTTTREDAHRVRIRLCGEVDLSTAYLVEVAVTEALVSRNPHQIYVDLAGVLFIDASAIHALLRCRDRAIEAGCWFAVTNAQPFIYHVLEIAGLLQTLAVTAVAAQPGGSGDGVRVDGLVGQVDQGHDDVGGAPGRGV